MLCVAVRLLCALTRKLCFTSKRGIRSRSSQDWRAMEPGDRRKEFPGIREAGAGVTPADKIARISDPKRYASR